MSLAAMEMLETPWALTDTAVKTHLGIKCLLTRWVHR